MTTVAACEGVRLFCACWILKFCCLFVYVRGSWGCCSSCMSWIRESLVMCCCSIEVCCTLVFRWESWSLFGAREARGDCWEGLVQALLSEEAILLLSYSQDSLYLEVHFDKLGKTSSFDWALLLKTVLDFPTTCRLPPTTSILDLFFASAIDMRFVKFLFWSSFLWLTLPLMLLSDSLFLLARIESPVSSVLFSLHEGLGFNLGGWGEEA